MPRAGTQRDCQGLISAGRATDTPDDLHASKCLYGLQVPVSERMWGFDSPLAHAGQGLDPLQSCQSPDSFGEHLGSSGEVSLTSLRPRSKFSPTSLRPRSKFPPRLLGVSKAFLGASRKASMPADRGFLPMLP